MVPWCVPVSIDDDHPGEILLSCWPHVLATGHPVWQTFLVLHSPDLHPG
jgi:hypothetical protein